MQQPRKNNFVLDSRDCPLLPTTELQCPFAKKGELCDVEENHECFGGAFKVAFRGITGHQSAVKELYSKITTLDDDLKSFPFGSQQINDRIVTLVWQNKQQAKNTAEDEIDVAKKISAVDTKGEIFPRYIHHCVIKNNCPLEIKEDYIRIFHALRQNLCFSAYFRYTKMIKRQFTLADSLDMYSDSSDYSSSGESDSEPANSWSLNIMYQEFGGGGIEEEIQKAMMTTDFKSYQISCFHIIRGLTNLANAYSRVLGKNGIAHMDIHRGNVVALASKDEKGLMSEFKVRLVDFGFSHKKVLDFVNDPRGQDPIEYKMMWNALNAINLKAAHSTDVMVMVRNKITSDWDEHFCSDVLDDDVWIMKSSYQKLTAINDMFFGKSEVSIMDLYEYVFECLKKTFRLRQITVPPKDKPLQLTTSLFKLFQKWLYGLSFATPETTVFDSTHAQKAKYLFDTYAISRVRVLSIQKLIDQSKNITVKDQDQKEELERYILEHLKAEKYYAANEMLKRFEHFYRGLEMIREQEFDDYYKGEVMANFNEKHCGYFVAFFLAASHDESVLLYKFHMTKDDTGGIFETNFLVLINKKGENIFSCALWHNVIGARFWHWKTGDDFMVSLWTEDSGDMLMDLGNKTYKKLSGTESSPAPVHVRRPAFADQEIKVTLPENFLYELVEEKTPSSSLWFRVLN